MISFQEENRLKISFWLLGDSFLRAFYSIYDGKNKRIGLVGDTAIRPGRGDSDSDSDNSVNPLVYILPGAIVFLCVLAFGLSCCIAYRIRKRQLQLQQSFNPMNTGAGANGNLGPAQGN